MCMSSAILHFNSLSLFINAWHNLRICVVCETQMLSGINNRNTQPHSVRQEREFKRERAVMTTLISFPSEPRGEKTHQSESQSCSVVVAAGISFAFVGSLGMNADGTVAAPSFHFNISRTNHCCFVFHSFWIIHVEHLLRPGCWNCFSFPVS